MNTIHVRRQLILDKHLNDVDYTNGSELNTAIIAAMEEYAQEVINKNAVLRNVSNNADICPECGYEAPEHKHGCSEYYTGR